MLKLKTDRVFWFIKNGWYSGINSFIKQLRKLSLDEIIHLIYYEVDYTFNPLTTPPNFYNISYTPPPPLPSSKYIKYITIYTTLSNVFSYYNIDYTSWCDLHFRCHFMLLHM